MATTYVQPTQREMEEALQAPVYFKPVPNRVYGGEIVYDWPVRNGVVIRVCSSIVPGYGGRDVGKDAIRILVVHQAADHVFWQATRVHRTKNWSSNMLERVQAAWDFIKKMPACELCGTPLHSAISKAGNPYKKCVDKTCISKTPNPFRRGG